jgi:hypothetical protein
MASSLAAAPIRPNPKLTPGDTMLDKSGAPVSLTKLCRPGYSKTVRNVPESLKREVFAEYGITPNGQKFEVDHLRSLELGGSNTLANLWPQTYLGRWNAHMKDALENRLHWLVCHDKLDLTEAQQEISTDWIAAYDKYITHGPKKGTK